MPDCFTVDDKETIKYILGFSNSRNLDRKQKSIY